MPIHKHDKQALDQLYSDWSDMYKGRTEDYFALLYLTKKFDRKVPDIAHEVCFGGCDYGIDAYHIDRAARSLYLFQFKWSENHNLFKESMERLAKDGLRRVFGSPLAQTFLASQGEIGRMSQLPEVFENQRQYDDTFRESYLHSDARKIVLAYKVGIMLRDPVHRLEELATQKIRFALPRARNLIWALFIQALFNDARLPTLLEDFGNNVKKDHAFREYLRKPASSKLLPILRDVLSKPEHAERMANEKYDFLRTKEIFNQCKDIAYERFEWTKKSL